MKLNADGTFPMWIDPATGRRLPVSDGTNLYETARTVAMVA